jgi:hypothetical protein
VRPEVRQKSRLGPAALPAEEAAEVRVHLPGQLLRVDRRPLERAAPRLGESGDAQGQLLGLVLVDERLVERLACVLTVNVGWKRKRIFLKNMEIFVLLLPTFPGLFVFIQTCQIFFVIKRIGVDILMPATSNII